MGAQPPVTRFQEQPHPSSLPARREHQLEANRSFTALASESFTPELLMRPTPVGIASWPCRSGSGVAGKIVAAPEAKQPPATLLSLLQSGQESPRAAAMVRSVDSVFDAQSMEQQPLLVRSPTWPQPTVLAAANSRS
eukprot:CAMPEP_0180527968 /NCGR_PEP_ID=MMETSP1036_2-20121128/60529_1 /TAXON_ID=632150 /ORGANISM="Azadinium spinosum, Strain 3D9" /LENGTH=136 /DNA_ID=CAMNT_0022541459 /DNA_START=18 /DNA_END=424 /DNA_ORIENTATION=+